VGGYRARNAVQVPTTAMAELAKDEEEENGAQQGRPRPRLWLLGEGALNRRGAWAGAARLRPGTSRPRLGGGGPQPWLQHGSAPRAGPKGLLAGAMARAGCRGELGRPRATSRWPRPAGTAPGRAPRAADRAWVPAIGARAPTRLHAGASGPRAGEETVRRGEGRGEGRATCSRAGARRRPGERALVAAAGRALGLREEQR
jgi:hypothetical protein